MIHLSYEVMLWRHFKIKCVLVPPCIGLLVAKYYPLPCRKSHIFSIDKDKFTVLPVVNLDKCS